MNRISVSSERITQVGYHEDSDTHGTLELKFSNGGVYQFFNIPIKLHEEFMLADSKESYYQANIEEHFPCLRVG